MSNKDKTSKTGSGIRFHRNIEMVCKGKKENSYLTGITEVLLILMAVSGSYMGFLTSTGIQTDTNIILRGIILIAILFWAVFQCRVIYKYILLGIGFVFMALCFVYSKEIKNGFFYVANTLIPLINDYYNIQLLEFRAGEINFEQAQSLFLLMTAAVSVFLTACVVCLKGSRIIYILGTFFVAIFPYAIGKVPDIRYVIIYASATIVLLGNGFNVQKEIQVKVRTTIMAATFFLFLIITILFPEKQYNSGINMEHVKYQIQNGMKKVMEGKLWQEVFEGNLFSMGASAKGGLSGGKLGRVGSVTFDGKTALQLETDYQDHAFYLKGYIGNEYTKEGWKPLDKETFKTYQELISQKEESPEAMLLKIYYRQSQMDSQSVSFSFKTEDGYSYDVNEGSKGFELGAMLQKHILKIKNIDAGKKNMFIPYKSDAAVEMAESGKINLPKLKNSKSYIVNFVPKLEYEWESKVNGLPRSVNYTIELIQQNMINRMFIETLLSKTCEDYKENDYENNKDYLMIDLIDNFNSLVDEKIDDYLFLTDLDMTVNEMVDYILYLDEYAKYENQYRQFVYDRYSRIPEYGGKETIKKFKRALMSAGKDSSSMYFGLHPNLDADEAEDILLTDIALRVKYVQEFLTNNAVYSLSPGLTPKGKDFVDYFMIEQKKGYCAYFATTATLLFRSMGIPCRYVEGYIVTEKDLLGLNLKTGTIDLKDTNAHAWPEIYVNGFGWVPVEVTPGYTDGDKPEEITNPQSPKKPENPSSTVNSNENKTTPERPKNTPLVTEKPNSSEDPGYKRWNLLGQLPKAIVILLMVLLLTLAVILYIIIRFCNKKILSKKYRKYNDLNKRILYLYSEMERIYNSVNELNQGTRLDTDLSLVMRNEKYYKIEELEQFVNLAKKAAFSQIQITKSEWKEAERFYNKVIRKIYQNASIIKRIYYKYIKLYL